MSFQADKLMITAHTDTQTDAGIDNKVKIISWGLTYWPLGDLTEILDKWFSSYI